jgi:hypothetical protein
MTAKILQQRYSKHFIQILRGNAGNCCEFSRSIPIHTNSEKNNFVPGRFYEWVYPSTKIMGLVRL